LLHQNRLTTLRGSDRFLPMGLATLTLNDNLISDLTDLSYLSAIQSLEQLTLANNPAIAQPEDIRNQFDYRPYVINWCLGIRVLDGIVVSAKERFVSS
jgi:centrosomal protein CEP97